MKLRARRPAAAACVLALAAAVCGLTGCEDSNDDGGPPALDIFPASVGFDAQVTNVLFTADGGEPPYAWSVNDPALGLVVEANDTAIYTSTEEAGQNFVTVTDSASNAVSATVNQF